MRRHRHDTTNVTRADIQTRYETYLDKIQRLVDHLTAEDQISLDHRMNLDTDKMYDAVRHLQKAKKAIRHARRAAIN